MAKRKPVRKPPAGVSRTAFAKHRGVSRNIVQRHLASGLLRPAILPDRSLDEALADALLDANLTQQLSDEEAPSDLTLARRRKTRASIRKLQDEIRLLVSEHAPIEEMRESVRPDVEAMATRLRCIPGEAAKGVVGLTPAAACEHVRTVIYNALQQLGDGHGLLSEPPDDNKEETGGSLVGNSVQLSAILTDMQAARIEVLREIKTGERVSVEGFFEALGRRLDTCRHQLIAIPTKLAPMLSICKSEDEARELIAADVDYAIRELNG